MNAAQKRRIGDHQRAPFTASQTQVRKAVGQEQPAPSRL